MSDETERPQGAAALDHLFRREAGRLVSLLARVFGVGRLEFAQDVVQDVFCRALEVWKFSGVPDNPSAWLTAAAKNRAIDILRREQLERRLEPDVTYQYQMSAAAGESMPAASFASAIADDELRMMFSCCHPELNERAQVALILNVLCGFSVREVAGAFLESEVACRKRLQRARAALASRDVLFEITDVSALRERLPIVQRALYLLFNEGYHGNHSEQTIRADLCEEATRLCALLAEHPGTEAPSSFALLALMCLSAARLPARLDEGGDLLDFAAQDRSKWDRDLVARGLAFVAKSASGDAVSAYHLEAAIAVEHAMAPTAAGTNWKRIVRCYDALAALQPGPVVLLNRAIAVGMARGPEQGLEALMDIAARERLVDYPFYDAALGEFSMRAGRPADARGHFERALRAARTPAERRFLEQRVRAAG
jgi:RNA polymerase sigma-70 factor (ECF subfamily)